MLRDPQNVPLYALDSFHSEKSVPGAFAGATTNARGDDGGTSDPYTLFSVVGDVLVGVYGVCTVDLVSAGGGTLGLGTTNNTTAFIAATTATAIDANELWMSTTPTIDMPIDSLTFYIVGNGEDIVEVVGTADITAGNIYYNCLWRPLTHGSSVSSSYPPTTTPT